MSSNVSLGLTSAVWWAENELQYNYNTMHNVILLLCHKYSRVSIRFGGGGGNKGRVFFSSWKYELLLSELIHCPSKFYECIYRKQPLPHTSHCPCHQHRSIAQIQHNSNSTLAHGEAQDPSRSDSRWTESQCHHSSPRQRGSFSSGYPDQSHATRL